MRRPVRRRTLVTVVVLSAALRVALIVLVVPTTQATWFAPFVSAFVAHPTVDPWGTWLASGGAADAFPYGPGMLLYFAAFHALVGWLPVPAAAQLGLGVGILAVDAFNAATVWRAGRRFADRGLLLYLLAPIVLFAAYLHGQLDLVPAALLLASMVDLRANRSARSGLWLGLAFATKASTLVAVPPLVLFFLRDARQRSRLKALLLGAAPGVVLFALLPLLPGYRRMVLAAPQFESVFAYAISLSSSFAVLVVPVVVLAISVAFWRFSRMNVDLLVLYTTVMLTVVPLLAPASPGWYLWAVPLLALLIGETRFRYLLLVVATWLALAASGALAFPAGSIRWTLDRGLPRGGLAEQLPALTTRLPWLQDLVNTAGVALGLLTAGVLLVKLGRRFDQYRLSTSPLSIAVAGDSGTGKDTLCISLTQVFGEGSTAFVMGDDYHRHERGAPAWRVRTHLDPAANDIARLVRDTVGLLRGDLVYSRHYDHSRGRFTEQRALLRGDLVVVSGLHVLTSTSIRDEVDLSVFLDMDENLRALLKIRRDQDERGHPPAATIESILSRAKDRETYVQPQEPLADLVLRLEPSVALQLSPGLEEVPTVPRLRLVLTLRGLTFAEEMQRAVVALVGVQATVEYLREPGAVRLQIEDTDDVESADIAAVAQSLLTRPQEVFVSKPSWLGGSFGLCQLVLTLAMLERRRRADEERSR